MAGPPDAFLSYTRFDDQHDGGAISELRNRLASARSWWSSRRASS